MISLEYLQVKPEKKDFSILLTVISLPDDVIRISP